MRKLFLLLGFVALAANAQDVIVKKDGSTILSKVLEVNPGDIKYKKFSNQNGPTYTINKSEVMSINYEGGDKDTFADTTSATNSNIANGKGNTKFDVNPNLIEDNIKLVNDFNSYDIVYSDTKTDKKASDALYVIGIKKGSIIETPELKASFSMKVKYMAHTFSGTLKKEHVEELDAEQDNNDDSYLFMMVVTLKNKTNKTVFVDLGNSFFMIGDNAVQYYVPTATTSVTGRSSGGAVNLGAVAGALGVGGSLGNLAGGVTMGGGNSSSTSKTTYSQRVISIPPMASVSLDPQSIGEGHEYQRAGVSGQVYYENIERLYLDYLMENGYAFKEKHYDKIKFEGLKRGEKINFPPIDNITPLSVHITYALDEMLSETQSMRTAFYWRQVMGVESVSNVNKSLFKKLDYRKCPLFFYVWNPKYINSR